MRYYFIRYQVNASDYEGFFYDTFSASYYFKPDRALKRYLAILAKEQSIDVSEIDVLAFNRI